MKISNSMVAHKWAHGDSGKGSNFYSHGTRLISYSTDVAFNTGRGLVFISADNMSPSTGRHLSYARYACSHLDVIYTPVFVYGRGIYDFDEKRAFSLACEALNTQLEGFSKARLSKHLHISIVRAEREVERLMTLAIKYHFAMPEFFELADDKVEAARVYAEQWDKKDAARRELARKQEHARQAAQREKDFSQFDLWHSGDTGVQCPYSFRLDADGGYYIAVRGDKVVTSGGAECPVEHARRGLAFWHSRELDRGVSMSGAEYREFTPWHRNGHRVQLGTFQLDSIDTDGTAYAGCHRFSTAELDRLAGLLL